MNQRVADQLDKVLALADSNHDGEAIVAVRKARQLLSRDGLSFSDLAKAATRSRFSLPLIFSGQQMHLETQLVRLQQQINDLNEEKNNREIQVEFWRRRAAELEQVLNLSQADAMRWKQLARETVEKLWDTGQAIANGDNAAQQGESNVANTDGAVADGSLDVNAVATK